MEKDRDRVREGESPGEAVKACVIQGPEGQVARKRGSLHSGPLLSPHREELTYRVKCNLL